MPLTLDQLREEIVALPPEDRQTLLDSVLESSPEFVSLGLHPDWAEEIRYRSAEYDAGRMGSVSLEEFEQELNQQAKERIARK